MQPGAPTGPGSAAPESDTDLTIFVWALFARWWVLAALAVVGAAAGLTYCHLVPPLFRAECRFEIFRNIMLEIAGAPDQGRPVSSESSPMDRHILLLSSRNLNARIKRTLNPKYGFDQPGTLTRFKLRVVPVRGASDVMLDIQVDSPDPEYSLEYINELLDGYHQLRLEEMSQVHQDTVQNLQRERENLFGELEEARNSIVEFEAEHNLQFERDKAQADMRHLASILQKEREILTQRTILESQFPFLKTADAATLQDVLDLTVFSIRSVKADGNPDKGQSIGWSEQLEWRENEAVVMRLDAEFAHRRKTYKPTHPKMLALQEKINAAKRELKIAAELTLKRLIARRDALRMQAEAFGAAAKDVRTSISLTAGESAQYENLKAKAEHLKSLHDKVYTRIIDSSSVGGDRHFSRIVDGPVARQNPVWPAKWKMVTSGSLMSAGIGAALVLLLFLRRMRMYNFEVLDRELNLQCLSAVPKLPIRSLRENPMFINQQPKSSVVCEVYRSLRTIIEQRLGDGKVLLLTSPHAGEGKTFTSVNIANVFAWSKERVLVIDGDLRRSSMRKIFPDAPDSGLVDCLSNEETLWTDCVVRNVAPHLDYLPAGHRSEHAAEMLESPRLARIMAEIRETYDLVLIDSAPANQVIDTILFGQVADAVLLIAMAGKTSTHAMQHAISRLGSASLIGYILNRMTSATGRYHYYSGYGGGHGYHYGYYRPYYSRYYYGKKYE